SKRSESPNCTSILSCSFRFAIFSFATFNIPWEISTPIILSGFKIFKDSNAKSPVPVATSKINLGLMLSKDLMAFLRQITSIYKKNKLFKISYVPEILSNIVVTYCFLLAVASLLGVTVFDIVIDIYTIYLILSSFEHLILRLK